MNEEMTELKTGNTRQWRHWMKGRYRIAAAGEPVVQHVDVFFLRVQQAISKPADRMPPSLRRWYLLNVHLYLTEEIERFAAENAGNYSQRYFAAVLGDCLNRQTKAIQEAAETWNRSDWSGADRERAGETAEELHKAVFSDKESPVDWMAIYRRLWRGPLRQKELVAEERSRIRANLEQALGSERIRDRLTLAEILFALYARDDETAARLAAECPLFHLQDIREELQAMERGGEWIRLAGWIERLLPLIRRAGNDLFHTMVRYGQETFKHTGEEEKWLHTLESMLPRSYYYYAKQLLSLGRFREWTDFHLLNGVSPLELHPLDVKAVQEAEPALLLPLYHQAAEKLILQKNRAAYRDAAKCLRKLRDLYEECGRSPRFDEYMRYLAGQYGRLRAFQEELQRSSLPI